MQVKLIAEDSQDCFDIDRCSSDAAPKIFSKIAQFQKPANATALSLKAFSGSEKLSLRGTRRFANSQRKDANGVRMRLAIVPARLTRRRARPT